MKPVLPNCTATCRDGSKCGRRVSNGSNPPRCHIHHRSPTSGAFVAAEVDPLTMLKRLATDRDKKVRVAAVRLLLSWQRQQDAAPVEASSTGYADFLEALSPEELATITDALARVRAVKDAVYLRRPELRPSHWRLPDVPPVVAEVAEAAPAPVARPKERKPRVQPAVVPAPAEPTTLPRALWAQVGIEELNGVPTHSLGDAHAQAILGGTIPFADAKAAHDEATAHGRRMSDAILS